MAVPTYPDASVARHEDGFLSGKDGLRLYYRRYTPADARATVAIAPGGGDHSGRYPALTSALVAKGFEVALLDFRGHGRSEGRRWHVDRFSEYYGDLEVFVEHLRAGAGARKLFLLGHSQGGLIAAGWGLAPGQGVAGVLMTNPFFRLKLAAPPMKIFAARLVGRVLPGLPMSTGLRYEDLTSDEEMQRWTRDDPLYGRKTTPRWFVESQRAQGETLARAKAFGYPLLILLGEADPIADPEAARSFEAAAGSADKATRTYRDLRHEILNERARERPLADLVAWVEARAH